MAQGSQNIGFSLPANTVRSVVDSIRKNGRVIRPYLGVRYQPITKALQDANHLVFDYGVLVSRGPNPEDVAVIPGSPADKAGLVENDIILEVDGQKVDADHPLTSFIQKKQVGDRIKLHIQDRGVEKDVTVTLEERPAGTN